MKKLFVIIITLLSLHLAAQEPCATPYSLEDDMWLKSHVENPFRNLRVSRANDLFYVPIKIHIVGDDNGNGYYRIKFLLNTLCNINSQFEQVGFHFYVLGDIDYIDNSALFNHTSFSAGNIVRQNYDLGALNMYFVENPAGACGYFTGNGNFPFIAVRNSCAGINNSTIAHEIGHYFSLPHPFSGLENTPLTNPATSSTERVDGSNCRQAGDRFCDTPADYMSERWNCPYSRIKTDFNGDLYSPDGSLFMSYSNDACQNRFSIEQIDAMNARIVSSARNFLLNHPKPDTNIYDVPEVLLPQMEEILPANFVQLKWKKAEGATHYFVSGSRFTNPNASSFEILTTDTALLLDDLTPGFRYRWKVQPINFANTCTAPTEEFAFLTTSNSEVFPGMLVNSASCNGNNDASIDLNPIGGTPPYTFEWSTGENTVSISNLAPGNYRVTISDFLNNKIAVDVDIVEPLPLDVEFEANGFQITAVPTGGTAPYTFLWSNGVTNNTFANFENGFYSVVVIDAKGCSTTKTSNGVVSVKEKEVVSGLKIFPNPAATNAFLNIEMTISEPSQIQIQIFDYSGREINNLNSEKSNGLFQKSIPLQDFSNGIYLIKITSGTQVINRKIVIF